MELKQHPLSAAFPAVAASDLDALAADIEANGLRNAITLFDGQIIDGWHRYQACNRVGVTPRFVDLEQGVDPAAFVLSLNLSRRHLSASQRAAAVAMVTNWRTDGQREQVGNFAELPPTTEKLAEIADVSVRTMTAAKAAVRAGRGEEVRDGKVSASAAVKEAKSATVAESEPEEPEAPTDDDSALDDLQAELDVLTRIVDADDRLAEAARLLKAEREAHAKTRALYEAQRLELASITKEARRWMKRCQKFEAGELK